MAAGARHTRGRVTASMSPRFFELHDDVQVPGRWHLDTPTDAQGHPLVNDWQLKQGTPVSIQGRLRVPIEILGRPLDFTEAGLRIPVVHVRVAAISARTSSGPSRNSGPRA